MNDFESPHERVCACKHKDRRAYRFMAGVPGEPGVQGERGLRGERGAVFTPAVDAAGNLTWTNDGGLPNPAAVNIRGPQGFPGEGGEPFVARYDVTAQEELDGAYNAGKAMMVRLPSGWLAALQQVVTFTPGSGVGNTYVFAALNSRFEVLAAFENGAWSSREYTLALGENVVALNQGRGNAGKVLTVGSNGEVSPKDPTGSIRKGTISLSTQWSGDGVYTQVVTVPGITITANSKVDIQPDMEAIEQFAEDGVAALYVENSSGTLTACAAGAAPSSAMTLQCTVTEVRA